jgi:hypothetical protein
MTACVATERLGRLTVFTSNIPSHLGKSYKLAGRELRKETAGAMVSGAFETLTFTSVNELRDVLLNIHTNQAISASIHVSGSSGTVVPDRHVHVQEGSTSRTKKNFPFPSSAGVAILDYDPSPAREPLTRDELWACLLQTSPYIAGAAALWWCSGSSFIFDGDGERQGLRGQRIYLLINDLSDSERFGEVLGKRLWLAGHGEILVSKSGQRLPRCTFDLSMFQPARLDFIGGAVCEPPLKQRRPAPVVISDGAWFDTRVAFPDLSPEEERRYEAVVAVARGDAEARAQAARSEWKTSRTIGLASDLRVRGVGQQEAEDRATQTMNCALRGVLLGDFLVQLSNGDFVSVADLLHHRERYDGELTLDPLEPDYQNGKVVGKLFLRGAHPTLFSFSHGHTTYRLRPQLKRLHLAKGRKAELAAELVKVLSGEPDVFLSGGNLVQISDGRVRHLKKAALLYLLGGRVALFIRKDNLDVPVDIPADVVEMVLGQVES